MQTSTHELLKRASRRKWACDKGNYPGEENTSSFCSMNTIFFTWNNFSSFSPATYYQITRFIQGYVDNEVNINPDASCSRTCGDYTQTRNYDCQAGTLCGEPHIDKVSTRCNGTILNCEFIDDELSVCPVSVL